MKLHEGSMTALDPSRALIVGGVAWVVWIGLRIVSDFVQRGSG